MGDEQQQFRECTPATCMGISSKTHEEIVIKLSKIETGQEYLLRGFQELNKGLAKISVQEERQINMQNRLDAAWLKIDTIKSGHDKCPIDNLKTQVNWMWVFLSSLALGLTMMFVHGVVKSG